MIRTRQVECTSIPMVLLRLLIAQIYAWEDRNMAFLKLVYPTRDPFAGFIVCLDRDRDACIATDAL